MRFKRAQVIVLANQKGGCGKTTTAISLAAGFALEGYDTCLVDLDSQCNVTTTFDIDHEELRQKGRFTVLDIYLASKPARDIALTLGDRFGGKLSLIAGHRALDQVKDKLEADLKSEVLHADQSPLDEDDIRQGHRIRLKNSLDSLSNTHDIIVIDTPPALDFLLTTALIAADWYVIPVFPSRYDLDGLGKLTNTIKKVKERANRRLAPLGVVLAHFDATTTLDKDVYKTLRSEFEDVVCETTIGRSVKHREATVYKKTIYEHAPESAVAKQSTKLVRELLGRMNKALGIPAPAAAPAVTAPVTEAANG